MMLYEKSDLKEWKNCLRNFEDSRKSQFKQPKL